MASIDDPGPTDNDRKRFAKLFRKLDINNDGAIEAKELEKALKNLRVPQQAIPRHAQEIISKADRNESTTLSLEEFIIYMHEHERQLRLAFAQLDKNKDGFIEPLEVQAAMAKMGVSVDLEEARRLTKRIDANDSMTINWEEWRDFFQLFHSGELEDMVRYWRQRVMIDIGENLTVPPEFTEKERKTGMWWRHLVAGGAAGVVSRSLTAPLDRVKVMMQVHGGSGDMSVLGGLRQMIQEGGMRSLWRGNFTNCLKIAPESAIKFGAYEQLKRLVADDPRQISVVERFACGSSAGAIAQTCIYPMEVVKTRLAVMKTGQYKGMLDCLIKVYQQGGVKSLFRGYVPNLIGIIPYAGIDLTIYETLKQMHMRSSPGADPGVLVLLGCGTVSSTCGQLASYPLALVRTKLQAQASADVQGNFVNVATTIVRNEGFRGLYRGIAPNFLKVLPAVSISYVIYERAKKALGVHK